MNNTDQYLNLATRALRCALRRELSTDETCALETQLTPEIPLEAPASEDVGSCVRNALAGALTYIAPETSDPIGAYVAAYKKERDSQFRLPEYKRALESAKALKGL